MRWENKVKEWTGMDFASSVRTAEDRTWWKGIVESYMWCPNDLARIWDRLD